MSNSHWALLEQIQQELKDVSDLPPTTMLAIANRLEEAIAVSTRLPLESLAKQLEELFNTLFSFAPIKARDAIRGSASVKTPENAAFMLGQVSFAQLLASQAAERRVDDTFLQSLNDNRYKPYLNALFQNARTGKELSGDVGQSVETVSRKLKELRSQGITDFRREGTAFYNFLTPAARAVLNDMRIDLEEKPGVEITKVCEAFIIPKELAYNNEPKELVKNLKSIVARKIKLSTNKMQASAKLPQVNLDPLKEQLSEPFKTRPVFANVLKEAA